MDEDGADADAGEEDQVVDDAGLGRKKRGEGERERGGEGGESREAGPMVGARARAPFFFFLSLSLSCLSASPPPSSPPHLQAGVLHGRPAILDDNGLAPEALQVGQGLGQDGDPVEGGVELARK